MRAIIGDVMQQHVMYISIVVTNLNVTVLAGSGTIRLLPHNKSAATVQCCHCTG